MDVGGSPSPFDPQPPGPPIVSEMPNAIPPSGWPGAEQPLAATSAPRGESDGSQFGSVVAGAISGFGLLLVAVGGIAFVKVWQGFADFDDSFGSESSRLVEAQRWASASGPVTVMALGLVVVALGFILRRLEQR